MLGPVLLLGVSPTQLVEPFSVEIPVAFESGTSPALEPAAFEEQEIVVSFNSRNAPADPLRSLNETSFEATVAVDEAVARPVALAYARAVPAPLRQGLRNALDNLAEPVAFINYVLQLKPVSALRTVVRFAVNSTVGLAGVLNVTKRAPFGMTRRRNGFANTLGYYGVKTGVFFYVPLIGPTTIRDLVGGFIDQAFLPFAVGKPFNRPSYTIPVGVLSAVDRRARNDDRIKQLRAADDPYLAARSAYLARRQADIDALHAGRR
jgi:phospholipid-binding lipoprotein MlaA